MTAQTVTHILVQSRLRDVYVYPERHTYKVLFTDRIKNVVKVDLISAVIPNTQLSINSTNNFVQYLTDEDEFLTAQIPNGNYDIGALLSTISDLCPGTEFLLDSTTGLVTINVLDGREFNFVFAAGDAHNQSIHQLLGFPNSDTGFGTSFTATFKISPPPPTLVTVSVKEVPRPLCKRVVRNLAAYSTQYSGRPEQTDDYVLGVIPLDVAFGANKWWQAGQHDILPNFVQPFDLTCMTIELKDEAGRQYDCPDEHSLLFAIHTCAPTQLAPQPCCTATSPIGLF
jgi:hypothetical protein